MWARWPRESWFSTWLLPLPAGLGQQQDLCPAEATTISNELCFLTWEKGLGKEWRHWAFPFLMFLLHESHLVCLRHNPSCWVCNLPICVNLQVKKKGLSPAADGSPESLDGTFHLDIQCLGIWVKDTFFLVCKTSEFIVRVLGLVTSCSPFSPVSSQCVKSLLFVWKDSAWSTEKKKRRWRGLFSLPL